MMRLGLSAAATALLRALIARTELPRDRILLMEWRSVDWQSLTFLGERHEISLRIAGPGTPEAVRRLTEGLGDAEFDLPGHLVGDIALDGTPLEDVDGSTVVNLEALTIAS